MLYAVNLVYFKLNYDMINKLNYKKIWTNCAARLMTFESASFNLAKKKHIKIYSTKISNISTFYFINYVFVSRYLTD